MKKIKAINVTGSGGGGIGLGTLLLGGLVALPVLRKLMNDFAPGGIKFDNIFGQGSGFKSEIDKWSNIALGVGITGWSIVALRNPRTSFDGKQSDQARWRPRAPGVFLYYMSLRSGPKYARRLSNNVQTKHALGKSLVVFRVSVGEGEYYVALDNPARA